MEQSASGPLDGIKIIELAGIGPAPMCAMLLADLGATVIRVERLQKVPVPADDVGPDPLQRGRSAIALDLKHSDGVSTLLRMVTHADLLIEGFRPGVTERLGIGPHECLQRNPRLVYGRMTGWGQEGPLAQAAGHDLNYIALTGVLHAVGRSGEAPVPPLNLVGDFGGGALYLAFGLMAALVERQSSGRGQVVDAAMIDGAASLMTLFYGWFAAGGWSDRRGENMLDGGTPWYDVYETADGLYVSIACLEARFFAHLVELLELPAEFVEWREQPARWPEIRRTLETVFRSRSRDEWCELLEGTDCCFAPVLNLAEAPQHAHNRLRHTFVDVDGVLQPNAAPRFSRTPGRVRSGAEPASAGSDAVLQDWGFQSQEIGRLRDRGLLG